MRLLSIPLVRLFLSCNCWNAMTIFILNSYRIFNSIIVLVCTGQVLSCVLQWSKQTIPNSSFLPPLSPRWEGTYGHIVIFNTRWRCFISWWNVVRICISISNYCNLFVYFFILILIFCLFQAAKMGMKECVNHNLLLQYPGKSPSWIENKNIGR